MRNPFLNLDSPTRRAFIERAAKSALGVSMISAFDTPSFGAAAPAPAGKGGKAKSVICLFLTGGMSHIDTFDPKTGATKGFKDPIRTKASGIQLGGYMTGIAEQAEKITIIRSMTSKTGAHVPGRYLMHTGYDQRGTIVHPTLGPWAQHFKGRSHESLPSSVAIGLATTNAGFFPPAYAPLPIPDVSTGLQNSRAAASADVVKKRLEIMDTFDAGFREKFRTTEVQAYTQFYDETMKLLSSKDLEAFDVSKESAATQELYGTGVGRSCLLARRLVQNGVRFVEVNIGGWDQHADVDEGMEGVGKAMDRAVAALLSDLHKTGLLESTMVVITTEFGRTPDINESEGRDHYPKVFSTMLAGGGVKGGYVYGSSDKDGREVAEKAVTPQDFLATIGAGMGLPVHERAFSPSGRPFTVGDKGTVVSDVFV
ncbi:DUF1501 domain-containing protein [Verrucomicrobium spinosum]|uniref:DUF1501 domain-containing protein n=2 Tax=Verrucomicrobium spinosum TaxID=2736 RepID=UPI00017453CD|nr:DUF1501 domain-containing protein [Verrucomicrobium spinosum]